MNNNNIDTPTGLMAWLPVGEENTEKILYLKPQGATRFSPYTQHPTLSKPDYQISRGSKGYATMQHLLMCGWKFESKVE